MNSIAWVAAVAALLVAPVQAFACAPPVLPAGAVPVAPKVAFERKLALDYRQADVVFVARVTGQSELDTPYGRTTRSTLKIERVYKGNARQAPRNLDKTDNTCDTTPWLQVGQPVLVLAGPQVLERFTLTSEHPMATEAGQTYRRALDYVEAQTGLRARKPTPSQRSSPQGASGHHG